MGRSLSVEMIPHLVRAEEDAFNVFRVLHHGTHEKQLSNLFAWLLNPKGSHFLGDLATRKFVEIVAKQLPTISVGQSAYAHVSQEVGVRDREDIADILLLTDTTAFVIENYFTSDGHGHSHRDYIEYGYKHRDTSVAVLLCQHLDEARQKGGWQDAPVVTYRDWLAAVASDIPRGFSVKRPAQAAFFEQIHSYYVTGVMTVQEQEDLVAFIDVLAQRNLDDTFVGANGVDRLIDTVSADLSETFDASKKLLQRVKATLKQYYDVVLLPTFNAEFGEEYFGPRPSDYSGSYQWTINMPSKFESGGVQGESGSGVVQIKWGPSASMAIERDKDWDGAWRSETPPDYTRLFLTYNRRIIQSRVSLIDVLKGLEVGDTRLVNEVRNLVTQIA